MIPIEFDAPEDVTIKRITADIVQNNWYPTDCKYPVNLTLNTNSLSSIRIPNHLLGGMVLLPATLTPAFWTTNRGMDSCHSVDRPMHLSFPNLRIWHTLPHPYSTRITMTRTTLAIGSIRKMKPQ